MKTSFSSKGAPLFAALMASTFSVGSAKAQDVDPGFYGFFNLGVLNYDDGQESESFFVDNSNAPSRIGVYLESPVETGTLIWNFETALGLASSASVNIVDGTGDFFDWDKTSLRKFEGIYTTPEFGTISLGQGSMATDGAAGADFSGTTLISTSAISDLAGGNFLRDTGGVLTGFKVGDTNDNFDGSRRFRVRYDTPRFSGFKFAAAYGNEILADDDNNDYYDIVLNQTAEVGAFQTNANLGYSWEGDDTELLVGSIAFLHTTSGLNGALALGNEKDGASYYWLKAGIRRDWVDLGETALSLDFYSGEDFVSDGSDSDSWAIAVVQDVEAANLEAFFVYREYGFNETFADYLDGTGLMLGARWQF